VVTEAETAPTACLMSKSVTKKPTRSSDLRQNRGIMRFLSDTLNPFRVFVTDLDTK